MDWENVVVLSVCQNGLLGLETVCLLGVLLVLEVSHLGLEKIIPMLSQHPSFATDSRVGYGVGSSGTPPLITFMIYVYFSVRFSYIMICYESFLQKYLAIAIRNIILNLVSYYCLTSGHFTSYAHVGRKINGNWKIRN